MSSKSWIDEYDNVNNSAYRNKAIKKRAYDLQIKIQATLRSRFRVYEVGNALPFILLTVKGSDLMPDNDIEQRIRERAFYIWIEQGQPEGKDREHWEQAEGELTAGVAAPQGQIEFARGQTAQHESASSGAVPNEAATSEPAGIESAAAMPGIDAIGQIKYAAAREVDQGGTDPALQPSQSAQSWHSYQSAAQSWDHYKQRCGGH